jgi:hypothetical protein
MIIYNNFSFSSKLKGGMDIALIKIEDNSASFLENFYLFEHPCLKLHQNKAGR